MLLRRVLLLIVVAASVSLTHVMTNAQAQDPTFRIDRQAVSSGAVSLDGIIYSQPPGTSGALYHSSRWDPDGSDYDQYVWDNFTLQATQVITEVQWRGGFDPSYFGSGGPVIDFVVEIYPSIAGGLQPDVANPPLVHYHTGGDAGQTPVGSFGGTVLYDYTFTLPASFQAVAGTKYWLQVEALQHGVPDWGITVGTGGDGWYFRRIAAAGDFYYQLVPGDAAFTLLGPTPAATPTPTATPPSTATPTRTPTPTPPMTAHRLYLPLILND